MFMTKIPLSNHFFPLSFNYGTNMTSHSQNQPNLIKNGLFPWHFYNSNLLKFVPTFLVLLGGGTHSSSSIVIVQAWRLDLQQIFQVKKNCNLGA
jgi:hypothetical protein